MERHTAFPDPEQPEWVRNKGIKVVKHYVAKAATENHAQSHIKQQITHLLFLQWRPGLAGPKTAQPPARSKPDQIGQAVPVNFQRPKGDRHRVKLWMLQHECSLSSEETVNQPEPA